MRTAGWLTPKHAVNRRYYLLGVVAKASKRLDGELVCCELEIVSVSRLQDVTNFMKREEIKRQPPKDRGRATNGLGIESHSLLAVDGCHARLGSHLYQRDRNPELLAEAHDMPSRGLI